MEDWLLVVILVSLLLFAWMLFQWASEQYIIPKFMYDCLEQGFVVENGEINAWCLKYEIKSEYVLNCSKNC